VDLENREKRVATIRFFKYVHSEVEYIFPLSILLKNISVSFSLGLKL